MAQTDRVSVVCQAIYDLLIANSVALGIEDVWLGDQALLPHTPAACVVPGPLTRELTGMPNRTDNNMTAYVMIYHSILQNQEVTEMEAIQVSEAVMSLLHQDLSLGGTVIHGYVRTIEPGYSNKARSWYRSSRVTWTGLTKTIMSEAA